MNSYLSRLNPTERRFVVGVALLFFVIINLVWVRPHFSDWGRLQTRLANARTKLANYDETKKKAQHLEGELRKMEGASAAVPLEDQAIAFLQTIQSQIQIAGVGFGSSSRPNTRTNQFFIEQIQTVNVTSGEKPLVDFLYNLGGGNSLIRVRDLSVHPDQPRQQLAASITLVASYQKKSAPKTAGPAASPATTPAPAPAAKSAPVKTSTPPAKPAPVKPVIPALPALATNKPPVASPTVRTSTPAARPPVMPPPQPLKK